MYQHIATRGREISVGEYRAFPVSTNVKLSTLVRLVLCSKAGET
jgi:hypothetical protein